MERLAHSRSEKLQVADFMAYEHPKLIVSIDAGKEWHKSIRGAVEGENLEEACRHSP